jgi:hypothetical protein
MDLGHQGFIIARKERANTVATAAAGSLNGGEISYKVNREVCLDGRSSAGHMQMIE